MIKLKKKMDKNFINSFLKKKKLLKLVLSDHNKDLDTNELISTQPYKPDLVDLCSLYELVVLNKRTTILEFGSGWSTLIFAIALSELKKKYYKKVENLRRNNPFELFVVDNEKKYLNITKRRINKFFKNKCPIKIHFIHSKARMREFQGRIATEYLKLPKCNPDFIYLDAPDQFNIIGNVNGINTSHKDMVPMSCDILKIEHFLNPGTIIVVDGRRSNVEFLKYNFQKKWKYQYLNNFDQHIFLQNDKPFGELIKKILSFYKS